MIAFDPAKLITKHVKIKMVSGALGGALTLLDEKRSKKAKKEVFTRQKISHSLARHFTKKYKVTKYLEPVLGAVTYYDGHVVCIDRHPLGNLGKEKVEGLFGEVNWESDSEANIERLVKPLTANQQWYIDGSYIYHVTDEDFANAEYLSSDCKFRQVRVRALKLCGLGDDKPEVQERVCLAFFPDKGEISLTPPIWKTLTNIGQRQLKAKKSAFVSEDETDSDDDSVTYIGTANQSTQFDVIDQKLCVNLSFALKAGRELSEVFGYDAIEPIGLDDLMIQLRTVNLPTIANEVKQTFDIGLDFTIAIAWLIGMTKRVNTLDSYIVLRSLLKYLTTKGVYRKGAFSQEAIFRDGSSLNDVQMMSIDQAREHVKSIPFEAFALANRVDREGDLADEAFDEDEAF